MSYAYKGAVKDDPTIIRGLVYGKSGRPVSRCGTAAGYRRHMRDGEHPCDPCRVAASNQRRPGVARRRRPGAPVVHGTNAGYAAHITEKSTPCQPCCDAHAANRRAWETRTNERNPR